MNTYTLSDTKPVFKYGESVKIHWKNLTGGQFFGEDIVNGQIVGVASRHIIDIWLVDFGTIIHDDYPYSTFCVPHTLIIKN
jgi:hypothetical protein